MYKDIQVEQEFVNYYDNNDDQNISTQFEKSKRGPLENNLFLMRLKKSDYF